MTLEILFPVLLALTTLLCALATGIVFTFSIITMPGIKSLNDREFIRAFQVMDGIIQNNSPMFMLVWVGSILALIATTVLGLGQLDNTGRILMIVATALYIVGMQLPTITINIPLNNHLQTLNVDAMNADQLQSERLAFEPRWNRWNVNRTIVASLVTVLLMVLLFML